ncbi:cytochrome c oxidase assembly factor 5-like [Xenia sp. Carnegie-2017]|uniref:cytochrome c oxidase assembly factor 5-like n=1 Tax=Xenia sp. Carnegie-2017 TaxID=2897299 RepID=UPI001F04E175|nr:cytochrome c oxidase assembly factor 5-like [Xenia sp. Carnegie-2017]
MELDDEIKKEACSGLRKELKDCLMSSECVIKYGHTPKNCLSNEAPGVTNECRLTQQAFFECKRSLLDFRNRFRGRKGY